MLLRDLDADDPGVSPWSLVRGFREGHDPLRVSGVVRHLGLLEQDVTLHRHIAGLLRPLHRPVIPVRGIAHVLEIAVEPADELCGLCTE